MTPAANLLPKIETSLVVGIDPSLTGLAVGMGSMEGYAEFELSSKALKEPSLRGRINRYRCLTNDVSDGIRDRCGTLDVSLMLIEGYSYSSKGSSVLTLAEFGGIFRMVMMDEFRKTAVIIEVPPTLLKKFVTGKGNASKTFVASELAKRYGRNFSTDNQADAFGLVKLGQAVLGYEELSTKFQKAAVDLVRQLIRKEP